MKKILILAVVAVIIVAAGWVAWIVTRPSGPGEGFVSGNGRIEATEIVLDEPTTVVDPLARNQFRALIDRIRQQRPGMSVMVSIAYMEEAERFDWLVMMDAGRMLATGTPQDLHQRTATTTLEAAFIELLPQEKKRDHHQVVVPPFADGEEIAIEARDLTMRFGDFK